MRVSQRLDHVLRALTFLAQREDQTPVAAKTIAEELGLPRRFLETQLSLLSAQGLVEARRGAGGGCSLARPAAEITVRQVVEALEGEILDVPHTSGSAVARMWEDAAEALSEYLDATTLQDLARLQSRLDGERAPMYHI